MKPNSSPYEKNNIRRAKQNQGVGLSGGDTPRTKKMESPYLTTAEAAQYLRISEDALRVRVFRKQITAYRVGKRLFYKEKELVRVMEKNRVGYEFGY